MIRSQVKVLSTVHAAGHFVFPEDVNQSWLPAFRKKIKNTQEVKKDAFELDRTRQNVQIFEEVLFHEDLEKVQLNESQRQKKKLNEPLKQKWERQNSWP